jgi:hypothetical protein
MRRLNAHIRLAPVYPQTGNNTVVIRVPMRQRPFGNNLPMPAHRVPGSSIETIVDWPASMFRTIFRSLPDYIPSQKGEAQRNHGTFDDPLGDTRSAGIG